MQPASDDRGHHRSNNGHQFTPGQFLAMGQQRGLDAASKSAITGFITKEDDIGTVESPFGKVQLAAADRCKSGRNRADEEQDDDSCAAGRDFKRRFD